jgi:hypothetical protein
VISWILLLRRNLVLKNYWKFEYDIYFFWNLNFPYFAKDILGGENGIEINIIIVLERLSSVIKNLLEKEVREIIIILIWETSTVAGVVDKFKVGKPREIYIVLRLEYSVLEKNET